MEQFIMKGGNPLVGEVTIGGAKNAALGILAASIMTDEDVLIENLPDVRDINVLLEAIQEIGASVDRIDRHTVKINASDIHEVSVDDEYIRRIRASYYLIGALLGKYREARCGAAWRMQHRQQTDRPASEGIPGPGCEGMDRARGSDLHFCMTELNGKPYLSGRGQCGCNHQYYAGSIQSQRHDHH